MTIITISGLTAVVYGARSYWGKATSRTTMITLAAGLFSLFVGLLVVPVEALQMVQAIQAANNSVPSIVMGGFYIVFVPQIYGFCWFAISLGGWVFLRREATDVA